MYLHQSNDLSLKLLILVSANLSSFLLFINLWSSQTPSFENCSFSVFECPLYFVEITVGVQPDDFMRRQALSCYHLGALPVQETTVTCVQPLSGRYVTIEEKTETYTPCMSLCDITIYEGGYTVSYFTMHEKFWFVLLSTLPCCQIGSTGQAKPRSVSTVMPLPPLNLRNTLELPILS